MTNIDDWDYILNTVDAMFYRLAVDLGSRADMSLADAHEDLWTTFEQGHFKLKPGDDDDVVIAPCETYNERRVATLQNKPLADYRRQVIEEEVHDAAEEVC